MQIVCQIVGALVLMSLGATLLLYVGFKRHQKNYKDLLSSIAGYISVITTLVFLFSAYFKSVEIHFKKMDSLPEYRESVFNKDHPLEQEIIDMRPVYFCDYNTDLSLRPDCILHPTENNRYLKSELDHFASHLPPARSKWL